MIVQIRRWLILPIMFFSVCSMGFSQSAPPLHITHLTGDFYIYTTYNLYKGEKIPANGMYLVTSEGVALFDSPWDTAQFQPLLDSIRKRHGKDVVFCIATHFHNDRSAGLEYYAKKGVKTYTTIRTDELSKRNGMKRAEFLIARDTSIRLGGHNFEVIYPGEGHTADNIIVWFNKERIIYGACLIKSVDDEDLGYLGDANTSAYAATLRKVQEKCPQPNYVIVGHGNWSSINALQHSIQMADALKQKNPK
jgi:metallo-beta-lactamase class B